MELVVIVFLFFLTDEKKGSCIPYINNNSINNNSPLNNKTAKE